MNQKNKMGISIFIGVIFLIYILVLIIIYFLQNKLLYHPGVNSYLDESSLNHRIEKIYIPSEHKLLAWHYKKDNSYKTLLFFHGNAGKLDNRIYKLNEISKLNLNYLIVAYRGFSGNEGKPDEIGLYKDSRAAKYWLNLQNVSDKDIILYGESLGTAIAIDLAKDHEFAGIILEAPFTSMVDIGQKYYPFFPVRLLLKDKYESKKKLKYLKSPTLVMHGKKDNIVPFYMGKEIYDLLEKHKFKYFSEDDDHMMEFNEKLINQIKLFINNID